MEGIDFEALFDAVPTAVALFSPDLVYVTVNRAYARMLGRPREEFVGRSLFEVFPGETAGGEAEALRGSMERVLTEGEIDILAMQRYDVESRERPGEVEERYWNVANGPLRDREGRVCGVVNRVYEVTSFVQQMRAGADVSPDEALAHMKAIEAQLFAQTSELHKLSQRLRSGRAEERRTAEALREAVRRQRELVAETSHDLRGPITGLQTRLQVALADPEADPREILLAALGDAERLGELVYDLLELAKLEADAAVETEPVDLTRLVRDEMLRCAPKITVVSDLEPSVVVEGSPIRLARLLDNLLSNAARHARSRLEIRLGAEGDQAVLEVMDDGPGIPEADREAVFRRFYRGPAARRRDPGGTGLGLPIARQIAEAHGGSLHAAENAPGAHLVLRLPLA